MKIKQRKQRTGFKSQKQKGLLFFCLGMGLFFTTAVTVGCLSIAFEKEPVPMNFTTAHLSTAEMDLKLGEFQLQLSGLQMAAKELQTNLKVAEKEAENQVDALAALAKKSQSHKNLSIETYEKMIVNRLGEPVSTSKGSNSEMMIFRLEKANFRGCAAKVKLKTKEALRVTLAPKDKPKGETTLEAAKRLDGALGINGGGFATLTKEGVARLVPMGNTMIGGKLVGSFEPATNGFAFAGFSQGGKLVGGSYQSEKKLKASGAWQGVSFVPSLIKNWEPLKIPTKWKNSLQPRTVLGQYPNGDLLFLVIDGRQNDWSKGISLEETQKLLLELGVMEAFNLDGGGSSTFVYDGAVKNKPSDGGERKLATNLVIKK